MANWGKEALGPKFLNPKDSHSELEFPFQLTVQAALSVQSQLSVTHMCQLHT